MKETSLAHDRPGWAALLTSGELRDLLVEGLGVSRYQILALDADQPGLARLTSFPSSLEGGSAWLPPDSPLAQALETGGWEHLAVLGRTKGTVGSALDEQARRQMSELGAEHAFALRAGERILGVLLVGCGADGQPLSEGEVRRLELWLRHLNLVLSRFQVGASQELLGQLSSGLAHDLRGWLTPIVTCLQLWSGRSEDQEKARALRPTALTNLEAIQACLEQARYYTKHQRPRFQRIRLNSVLRRAAALAESGLKAKSLTLAVRGGEGLEAQVDQVLMLRLVDNLLSNAIRAAPTGTEILVSLERQAAEEGKTAGVRLCVVNAGPLAVPDGAGRPTPAPETPDGCGPDDTGWGLGLRICREIVQLHGGTLTLTSVGHPPATTVRVDLPQSHREPHCGPAGSAT